MTLQNAQKAKDVLDWLTMRRNRRYRIGGPRCWGASSDAMMLYGLRGPFPAEYEYPHDRSDYEACVTLFNMAPDSIQRRMACVLEEYRQALIKQGVEV